MALSKDVKSIVICIIAAFVGVIALLLVFVDFGWGGTDAPYLGADNTWIFHNNWDRYYSISYY